jgi:hypothetical protein
VVGVSCGKCELVGEESVEGIRLVALSSDGACRDVLIFGPAMESKGGLGIPARFLPLFGMKFGGGDGSSSSLAFSSPTTSQSSSISFSTTLSLPFSEKSLRDMEWSPLVDDDDGNLPRLVVLLRKAAGDLDNICTDVGLRGDAGRSCVVRE